MSLLTAGVCVAQSAHDGHEALAWLDEIAPSAKCKSDPLGQRGEQHARTIRTMLRDQHERAIRAGINALRVALVTHCGADERVRNEAAHGQHRRCVAALEALIAPKTIEVAVWSVAYAVREHGRWVPAHSSVLYENKADAEEIAANKRTHGDCAFVKVMGPFTRTVPVD